MVHPQRLVARELADIVERWWQERGVLVHTDDGEDGPSPELFRKDIDVAISLGGDGTMLRTVALSAPSGIPVLGVNLGNLGYLTTVEPDEITQACALLTAGDYTIEDRMLLEVSITSGVSGQRIVSGVVAICPKCRGFRAPSERLARRHR